MGFPFREKVSLSLHVDRQNLAMFSRLMLSYLDTPESFVCHPSKIDLNA
jgi:hypothetical protein